MSVEYAVRAVRAEIERRIVGVSAFRATVTAVDGSLVQIRREGATTGNDEQYASCTRFLLAVGDVVLCIPIGGKPVIVDVIRRSAADPPSYTVLASAGSTATASINHGDDTSGLIYLTPGGAGIAAGTVVQLDFAVARASASYAVMLTRRDLIAGNPDFRVTGQTVDRFRVYSAIALTSGSQYEIQYHVRQDG